MSSRLFREVREKRGLVYEVGTHIKRFSDTGAFIISAGCDVGKLPATLRTIFKELARMCASPVSDAELRRAKDYYAGQLVMGLEDPMDHMLWIGEQAVTVGRVARLEPLLTHMAKVTGRDIQRVARTLFRTDRFHAAIVGSLEPSEAPALSRLCRL